MTVTLGEWATPTGQPTADGELSFGGLLMGRNAYRLHSLEGWDDSPDYDIANVPRPAGHGAWPGAMYAQTRTVTVTLQASTDHPDELQQATAAIRRATAPTPTETPLTVQLGQERHTAWARCIRRSIPTDLHHALGIAQVVLQLEATDPRRYGDTLTATTGLPADRGAVPFPWVFPVTFDDTGDDGDVRIPAGGTVPSPPLLQLTGQVVDPLVSCPEAGWRLDLAGLTVAAGDVLEIDPARGSVTLNGANRAGSLTPMSSPVDTCLLPPDGATVSLRGSGTGQLTVTHRPAHL